jgi:beta-lactamase regulating signal transducer with metallopeptidase domain
MRNSTSSESEAGMEQLFQHGLSNAAAAALLAFLAASATRIWRNPHFAYAAWLIVLVRLVAPPLVAVNVPMPAASTLANYGSTLVSRAVGLRPLGPRMNAAPTVNRADKPTDSQTKSPTRIVREAGSIAQPNEPNPWGSADPSSDGPRPIVGLPSIDVEPAMSPAELKRLNKGASKPNARTVESIARRQDSERRGADQRGIDAAFTKLSRLNSGTQAGENSWRSTDLVLKLLYPLKRLSVTQLLTAIWLGGTCGYLLLVCVRAVRFSRALRSGRLEVSESLRAEAVAAAATVGLRRRPRLAILAAPLPPFVWPGWRPTVLLPQALVESLGVSQRRLLLLHEFVHLRRFDHRVRWFQIGVVALCWWNPVAWWAARRLERAEEECCDAAVLRLQPDQAEGYGQTLVAVTEFLSTGKLPAPALSIGIVGKSHLKRRLTMILSGPRWPGLSKTRFAVLATVGAALVALTWRGVTAQNVSTKDPVSARWFSTDTKTAVPAHNVPTSDPVVERWFKTGTKTALGPSNAAPSRADARLASLLKLEPLQPEASDDERQKLLKERYNAALSEVLANQQQLQLGAAPSVDRLCRAARDLFESELALVTSNRDKVRILEHYVDYCNKTWTEVNARMNSGLLGGGSADESRARGARLEAEIRLNEFHAATDAAAPEAASDGSSDRHQPNLEPQGRPREVNPQKSNAPTASATFAPAHAAETDGEVHHRSQFTVGNRPDAGSRRFLLDLMYPVPRYQFIGAPDDEAGKLRVEKYNAAAQAIEVYRKQMNSRTFDLVTQIDNLLAAGRNLRDAELAFARGSDSEIGVLEAYLDFTRYLEQAADGWVRAGGIAGIDAPVVAARMREARVEAELNVRNLRHEMAQQLAQRELRNPPPYLKEEPTNREGAPSPVTSQSANHPMGRILPEQAPQPSAAHAPDLPVAAEAPSPPVFNVRPKDAPKGAPALFFAAPLKIEPGDDEWRKLLKEKYNAAASALQYYRTQFDSGTLMPLGDLLVAGRNVRDAELAFDSDPRQQLPILEAYLQFTKYLADIAHSRLVVGGVLADTPVEAARMREARADAELQVLQLRGLPERNNQPKPATSKEPVKAPSAARDTAPPAVSLNADMPGMSSAMSARADGAGSFAGPAPDIHNASGPLNPNGKSLIDLVKFDDQQPQPGESAPRKQLMEHYNEALHSVKSKVNQFEQGKTSAELLCNAAREFTDARLALFEDPWERIPIANWYSVFALKTWREAEAKLHAGGNTRENRDDAEAAQKAFLDARAEYAAVITALPALMTSKIVEISPNDDDRQKLLKERYNAALRALRGSYVRHRVDSTVPFTEIIAAARQVLPADVALQTRPEDRLRVHEQYFELMKYLEKEAEALRRAQVLAQHELDTAHEARVDAEIKLFDARQSGVGQQPPPAQGAAEAPRSREAIVSSSAAQSRQAPAKRPLSGPLPAWLTAEQLKIEAGDDDHKKLLKERYNAALQSLKAVDERRKIDPAVTANDVIAAARQLLAADVALHKSGDIVPSYERYFEFTKFLENIVSSLRKDGMGVNAATYEAVHEARLDAEVKLLDVKGGTAPAPARARSSGKK